MKNKPGSEECRFGSRGGMGCDGLCRAGILDMNFTEEGYCFSFFFLPQTKQ